MAFSLAMSALTKVCPTREDLHASEPGHRVGHRLRRNRIDDDHSPGFLGEFGNRDHCGDHRWINHVTALVDQETSIGIAVEDQAEIGGVLTHRGACIHQVLRFQGVRGMVRESAVRLHVQTDQFHIAIGQDRGNGEPAHPRSRRPRPL